VGSRLYFFHTNHEGTPERISDATGNVVWSARYEAFGRAHIEVSAIDNPLRFAGQYFDAETGLHYNRFRYYDPRLGRYWSVDPAGLIGGHNLYTYVGNNPINRVDPLGLWWKAALSVVAGVAVAALVIATAPVSLPALAIGAMAVTAGAAVGLGLNEYLTTDHFCWPCLARGFAKGAAMTLGAALAVALVAEASVVAATVVAVGVVAYGVYSLGNMAFHWDNMTHEQRVEAIGGMLGSVAMGYVVGATGAPPTEGPPPGYAYAVTPTGETVLVPVGEATTTGAPVVAMNAGDGSGSGDDADNSPEARRARAKQKLEENQRKARERDAENDRARDEQNRLKGERANKIGKDAENQSLEEAKNNPERDPSKPILEDEAAIRKDNDIPLNEKGEQPKLPDHSFAKTDGTQRFTEVKNENSTDAKAVTQKFETVSQSSKYPNQEYVLEMREGSTFNDPAYSTGPDGTLQQNGQQVTVGGRPINVVTKPFPH